jgi:hypothetical protein
MENWKLIYNFVREDIWYMWKINKTLSYSVDIKIKCMVLFSNLEFILRNIKIIKINNCQLISSLLY